MSGFALIRGDPSSHADWAARGAAAGLKPVAHALSSNILLLGEATLAVQQAGQELWIGGTSVAAAARQYSDGLEPPDDRTACTRTWGAPLSVRTAGDRLSVTRDPGGALACHHLKVGAADVLVSDVRDAAALGALSAPSLNEYFLRHWIQFPYLRSRRTGLRDVTELLPGTTLEVSNHECRELLSWHPPQALFERSRRASPEAIVTLRDEVLGAVAKQLSGEYPLLQLSGGLDSSIIAAVLRMTGIRFAGVVFVTRSRDGDELGFAQAVALHCGITLGVVREDDPLPRPSVPERTYRPGANLLLRIVDDAVEQYRLEHGFELLIDGAGGDNLFGSSISAAPAADALLSGAGLGSISDVARRTQVSWWSALRGLVGEVWGRREHRRWPEDRRFLAAAAMLERPDPHPWLDHPPALPGQDELLRSLVHIQHFLDRHATRARVRHPLYCRPLLDHSLRTPTWWTIAGGRDRALVRQAFAGLLPPQVVERRDKGSLEGLLFRRFVALEATIRELLLGGVLRHRGLLDIPAIERALHTRNWAATNDHVRLSELATLEEWARTWT